MVLVLPPTQPDEPHPPSGRLLPRIPSRFWLPPLLALTPSTNFRSNDVPLQQRLPPMRMPLLPQLLPQLRRPTPPLP
jgi:hypothetical protein